MRTLLCVALLCAPLTSAAQSYPSKPVRLIVPYAAGGAVDLLARTLSPRVSEAFAQPLVVENRAGAGGNIGADLVAKAAPDGYTILLAPVGQATSPALFRKLPYDPMDLAAVTQLVATEFVMVSFPKLPATTVKEVIGVARARNGGLNYGSTGIGTAPHLSMELLAMASGTTMTHVPYKGDAPLNAALMAGEVDVAIVPTGTALPLISAGKLRALGTTGAKRARAFPDVPAVAETLSGYEFTSWQGLFVPAKTPREVVSRIHRDTVRAINAPDVRDKVHAMGADIVGSTPDEFQARYRADLAKFARVVKEAKIPLQE
jgi:tripartite-type tricarboxylate transporter receptor subunit TctC